MYNSTLFPQTVQGHVEGCVWSHYPYINVLKIYECTVYNLLYLSDISDMVKW